VDIKTQVCYNTEQYDRRCAGQGICSASGEWLGCTTDCIGEVPWNVTANLHRAIETIDSGVQPGSLKQVTFGYCHMFSTYLQACVYDGLKAAEGGEGNIGAHSPVAL